MSSALNHSEIIANDSNRKIFDFNGGIHPDQQKDISNQTPIEQAPIPPALYLPLQQHIGRPAKPIMEIGQRVLKGELIAEAQGAVSAGVHAPTSGTIEAIQDHSIAHPSGLTDRCIILTPDGKDEWCQLETSEHYENLSIAEIQKKVRAAGIAGMGGAGFPTEVKLHPPQEDKVQTLILNAVECEPYITADDRLMRERAEEIVKGMEIIAYVLQPGECLIGIEDNKPEAIAAMKAAVKGTRIEVVVVPTKYPSGGEKQLIKLLTNKEVPSGRIPADVGVMCQNVGTAHAIFRAVRYGEPLISRITTLTGEQFGKPGNVEVLLGTPIDWLIDQYGYTADSPERLIMGGPMMGFAMSNKDTPVVKTTNCILAPSQKEFPLTPPAQACIRCGLCAEACPAELLPQQLYWFSRAQEFEKAEHHNLFDCIECGACSYVCPSSIPLVHYYRHAKGEIKQQKLDQQKADKARMRHEARVAREEREAAEKEAKRQARAEAAAKAQAAKKAQAAQAPAADANKAAVQEALERSQAKKPAEAPEAVDLDKLKQDWDKAQSKLDKMIDALEDAKANNPDNVEKLKRAVEKNQLRVNQAKQAFETAQKAEEAAKASNAGEAAEAPDLDALQTALDKAKAKLDKMLDTLEDAKENQPDNVEKFTRAVEKNRIRVDAAEKALNDAKAQVAASKAAPAAEPEPTTELPDIEALETAFEKAKAKLEKMIDTLEDAKENQPDNVEKFTRAVEKNRVRVDAAEKALNNAKAQIEAAKAAEASAAEPEEVPDIEALEVALEKAQIKLDKMIDTLEDAKENQPDNVEKFTRAVEKNKVRVNAAEDALAEARKHPAIASKGDA